MKNETQPKPADEPEPIALPEETIINERSQRLHMLIGTSVCEASESDENNRDDNQREQELPPLTPYQEELITSHIALAKGIAKRYHAPTLTYADLVQYGCLGLTKAARRFDPTMGNQFSSFATPQIIGEISHAVRDHGKMMREPRQDLARTKAYRQAIATLISCGLPVTDQAIAEQSGLSQEDIEKQRYVQKNRAVVFHYEAEDRRTRELEEAFIDPQSHVQEKVVDRLDVAQAVEMLPQRLKEIIKQRYGLPPYTSPSSQSEVGKRLGCSQTHVWRMEMQAFELLKGRLAS